jgi:hypothetical protein
MLDLGANIAVSLLDVSESGVRMLVKDRLDFGQELTVYLESVSSRRAERLAARVIWCVETAGQKQYVVGVRFDKRLQYTEWQKMS